jgi:UPF0042 nucleotide-binding protein
MALDYASDRVSEFVIITGLAGAGRSTAANVFEDMGWFVIDNLPPVLISQMAELVQRPGSDTSRVVFAVGTGAYFDELGPAIEQLRKRADKVRMVFLDASDDVLVRRFEGTRRRHALEASGLAEAVEQERELLTTVKGMADVVIDTSDLNVHQLRERITELFSHDSSNETMRTAVVSFGYKHGLPLDVDMVLDCRFLPNPHWDESLRPQTGLDAPVRDFVMGQPETAQFLERLDNLLELLLPAYVNEGKSYLTVAVGCTGGRHRSVALAEEIAKRIRTKGFDPTVSHRDITK